MPSPRVDRVSPALPPPCMTPTRRVRVEALRRALHEAEQAVAHSDRLVRQLSPWFAGR